MTDGLRIKNFIWDFDGMLFDTYPHTVAAFCEQQRRHGFLRDEAEVYALFKINLRVGFRHYGLTEEEIGEFYEIENDLSFEPLGVPYPRIPEILLLIAENGGRNYLYTHRDRVALQYLEIYGLTPLFADAITGEDGFPFKPAPDALEYMIKKNCLNKNETVMLGDRDIDIGAGQNAGLHTLLFDEDGRYGDLGETRRAANGDELLQAVKELLADCRR